MKALRLIATWLLLLALPVQGLAAYTPSARCSDSERSAHAAVNQHHAEAAVQAHDHSAGHQQHNDGQPADQASGHACCHHVFSGVPSTAIPGIPAPPLAISTRVALLTTLFIPELLPRPPRA
jgi:hypothetical protein